MNDAGTILAVDDTPESLALLVRTLTTAGYQVRPADSGELALAAVAANPPDLILLDVHMKGNNLLDTCAIGAQNTPAPDHAGRLWSLWDMLKVKAEHFVEAAHLLATIQHVSTLFENQYKPAGKKPPLITAASRKAMDIDDKLEKLRIECDALGLRLTVKQINRCLNTGDIEPGAFAAFAHDIYLRFRDELTEVGIYFIEPNRAQFYEKPLEGWGSVIDRFGCSFDVEEARKCLGLERYTAAVFHLMRITEAAVLELQVFLGDKDVKAHFGSVLDKLERTLQRDGFSRAPEHLKSYVLFLQQVLTQLHAVKDSWRDKVSHVDERIVPIELFTEEMAIGVHDATLLLMKKLAGGLPPKPTIS